jgi:hypothetical protein
MPTSPTAPPSLDALPASPDRTDRVTFNTRIQAWVNAWPTFAAQLVALAANLYASALASFTNASEAATSATSADASRLAAAASAATATSAAAATLWSSGSYAAGVVARSPSSGMAFVRLAPGGASPTDPALDPTNWRQVSTQPPVVRVTGTAVTMQAGVLYELANGAATTATLPAAPQPNDVVWIQPLNGLSTNVVARAGNRIMSLLEDMVVDVPNAVVCLRYVDAAYGWRVVW